VIQFSLCYVYELYSDFAVVPIFIILYNAINTTYDLME